MAERQLLIKIIGDAKSFVSSLGEAEAGTEGLSGKFKGLAAVAAGALSVGAVVGFAKSSVSAFEDVAKSTSTLTRLTGDTAENMSRLRFAAEESGISSEKLEGGIKKLSKALMGASDEEQKQIVALNAKNEALGRQRDALEKVANPTDAQRAKLQELTAAMADNDDKLSDLGAGLDKYGIAMQDANGKTRPMNDILLDVAAKFKDMPNGIEKNALAMKLFGKSGTDLLPFLNRGAEGIKELEAQSDKFGLTIGQKNVDDMKKNVMAHREMNAAIEGLKVQLGERLMPIIAAVSVWIAENLPKAIAAARQEFAVIRPYIEQIATFLQENFLPAAQAVWGFLQDNQWVMIAVGVAIAALVAPVAVAVAALIALVAGVTYAYNNFETFRNIVDTTMRVIQTIITDVAGAIEAFWRTWGAAIMTLVAGLWQSVRDTIEGALTVIRGIVNVIMGLIHGDFGQVWEGIKQIFSGALEYIRGLVETVIAIIRGIIEVGMTLIAGIFDAAWSGIKTVISRLLDDIVQFMRDLPGRILAALGYLGDLLVNIGTEIINGLFWGITQTAQRIWEWMRLLPTFITDMLSGAGGWLLGIGEAIIQGLWDGMKSIWNNMTGWIGSIGGWIKDLKGPLTKDKVLLTNEGYAIMSGLHEGMKAGWEPIEGFLSSRQAKLTGRFGASIVGGGGGVGGGPTPIVMNIYSPNYSTPADVQTAGAQMRRELAVALRGSVSG